MELSTCTGKYTQNWALIPGSVFNVPASAVLEQDATDLCVDSSLRPVLFEILLGFGSTNYIQALPSLPEMPNIRRNRRMCRFRIAALPIQVAWAACASAQDTGLWSRQGRGDASDCHPQPFS